MSRALPYMLLSLMVFAGLVALAVMNPLETRRFLLTADIFGLSPESRAEATRIARISSMRELEDWQREALKHKQVFKQASVEMTKLALGTPNEELDVPSADPRQPLHILIYLFDDSTRYTSLWFAQNKLYASQQLAAPDVERWRAHALTVAPKPEIIAQRPVGGQGATP